MKRRMLNLKAKFEGGSSYLSFKALSTCVCRVNLHRSTVKGGGAMHVGDGRTLVVAAQVESESNV
jgi:hypothetical protein